jgi:tetratricopeptide (TPR) repeat protein
VCGYILGFGLGLIAERLIVGNQAQGKYAEAKTHSDRGVAHYYLGEKARAIEDYDQALRIDPGNAATYNDRGVAYYDLGDSRRAIEDYDTALRIDPDYAYAYNNRGNAYNRLAWDLYLNHSNAEALTYVDRALADRLNEAAIIGTRAHVLAALGRRREAVDEFERATQMGGSDLVRRYQEALKKHGHYRGAIDGAYGPNTRAALVACINAGCRLLE